MENMMAKSKAQTKQLWDDMLTMYDNARSHLATDFLSNYETVKAEIEKGGPEDYMRIMQQTLDDLAEVANSYWLAHRQFARTIAFALAQYAGAEDPTGSEAAAISKFAQKLIDDSESVASLGLTTGSWSAGGSNVGNAVVVEVTVDPNGDELDCGHNEDLKLECISIGTAGRPQWNLQGAERKQFLFDPDDGTGNSGDGYMFNWGTTPDDFSKDLRLARTSEGAVFTSWHGADHRNLVQNGSFEEELGTGTSKIPGATITSGEANIGIEDSSPIAGSQSLEISGDGALEFPLIGGVRVGVPFCISSWIQRVSTFTGTLTIKLRSGASTDHLTITQDLSAITAGVDTNKSDGVIIPNDIGENPRVRIEVATSGGSGSVLIDMLVAGIATLFDGNRAFIIAEGPTGSRRGDVFTATNSITVSGGEKQRMMNELFGRHLPHEATATYWS